MDTNTLAHALMDLSFPLTLAAFTTATFMLIKQEQRQTSAHVRQRVVTALRRQAATSSSTYNRRKGLSPDHRLRIIRLPGAEQQRQCIGVIAPEHLSSDQDSTPVRQSGPPENN